MTFRAQKKSKTSAEITSFYVLILLDLSEINIQIVRIQCTVKQNMDQIRIPSLETFKNHE